MSVRFIVVGFGFMGQTHAGNILKNPRAELAAIVDPYPPADRLASIKGNKATVSITVEDVKDVPHCLTMEEAFAKVKADAVIIALPTKLHYSAVMQCLKQGYHVMVEKPFSIHIKECEEMTAEAEKQKKLLAVGYVVRCMKEYQILKDYILTGKLGKLSFLHLSRITGVPAWGNWNDPEFVKASGGALYDLFSHDADIARFCLGDPAEIVPDRIVCSHMNGNMVSSIFRYPGCDVRIDGGFVTPSTYPFRRSFCAYFENGTLLSEAQGDLKIITKEKGVEELDLSGDNPYYTEVDHFITGIGTGDLTGVCTGKDAAHSIRCCDTIANLLETK